MVTGVEMAKFEERGPYTYRVIMIIMIIIVMIKRIVKTTIFIFV